MSNDWTLKKKEGGNSGDLIDGTEIRISKDGTAYELIAVLATKSDDGKLPHAPFEFPQFAYRGLIWNIGVQTFNHDDEGKAFGPWTNNFHRRPGPPPAEEDGTYTGQAGPGTGGEEDCKEDAASASA